VLRTDRAPVAGSSLRLTIDSREQALAQQALEWGMRPGTSSAASSPS
jgi:cell division protein FtsI/penicillin-binding protein 2